MTQREPDGITTWYYDHTNSGTVRVHFLDGKAFDCRPAVVTVSIGSDKQCSTTLIEKTEVRKRIIQLFKQASSKDEIIVAAAYNELVQLRCDLERADVDHISKNMRNGGRTWKKVSSRESHCTWFEYTRAGYYAASAILQIEADRVEHFGGRGNASSLLLEAHWARTKRTERVTDPGWI